MKVAVGLVFAGALLTAAPVFAQSLPAQVVSGAMPEVGTDNAQTADTDYGGMPLAFARPKAKPAKVQAVRATAPAQAAPAAKP